MNPMRRRPLRGRLPRTQGASGRVGLWKLLAGLSVVAATLMVRGAVPTFADTDYRVDMTNNPDTGYWQICTGSYCYNESINYTFAGTYGADGFHCGNVPPCRYHYFIDYENQSTNNAVESTGDAINGYCCPDVQVSINPDQYVLECYHSRADCGNQYVAYRVDNDSQRIAWPVTCPGNDYCVGWGVQNEEQQGFVDPFVVVSACEVAEGYAVANGGTCDGRGYYYDYGQ